MMDAWGLALQNILIAPATPWQSAFVAPKAHRAGPVSRPSSQALIRAQCAQILAMLADGEMTTPAIVAHIGLHESLLARRLERLCDEGSVVKRIQLSKVAPNRVAWWRLA